MSLIIILVALLNWGGCIYVPWGWLVVAFIAAVLWEIASR